MNQVLVDQLDNQQVGQLQVLALAQDRQQGLNLHQLLEEAVVKQVLLMELLQVLDQVQEMLLQQVIIVLQLLKVAVVVLPKVSQVFQAVELELSLQAVNAQCLNYQWL